MAGPLFKSRLQPCTDEARKTACCLAIVSYFFWHFGSIWIQRLWHGSVVYYLYCVFTVQPLEAINTCNWMLNAVILPWFSQPFNKLPWLQTFYHDSLAALTHDPSCCGLCKAVTPRRTWWTPAVVNTVCSCTIAGPFSVFFPPLLTSVLLHYLVKYLQATTHSNAATCESPKKSKGVNGVLPSEARRADKWGGVLGEADSQPPAVRGLGERCKLPQWGPGWSPGRSTIFLYVEVSRQLILLRY